MAWTLASGTITQSGTDTSLVGLSGIAGVTVQTIGVAPLIRTVYNVGTLKLAITGALTHTPEIETLAFIRTAPDPRITVALGGTYDLGVETTVNGDTRYSQGDAIIFTSPQGFNEGADFDIKGAFNWRGGTIFTNAWWLFDAASTINIFAGRIVTLATTSSRLRQKSNNLNVYGINVDGAMRFDIFLTPQNFVGVDATFTSSGAFQAISSVAGGNDAIFTLSDFNAQGVNYIGDAFGGRKVVFENMAYTGDFLVTHNSPFSSGSATELRKDITVAVELDNVSVPDAVYYMKDVDNGLRKPTLATWRSQPSVDYIPDRVYIGATDANGTASAQILTRVAYGGTSPQGVYQNNTIVDHRSKTTDNTDVFDLYVWAYETLLATTAPEARGAGTLAVPVTTFADPNVSLTRADALSKLASSFTVDLATNTVTVTANSTYDDLYDVLKAYKSSTVQAQIEAPIIGQTIVTANGSNLTAYAGWTLIVNSGVTLATGTKFTFVQFTTITNNGAITGVYGTPTAGRSTKLDVQAIKAGASFIVADNATKATILYGVNNEATAQTYSVFFPPGSAGTQVYVARQGAGDQFDFAVVTLTDGEMFVGFNDIPDEGLTQTNLATVAAYTTLETTSKLYDYITYYRTTEAGIKLGNIVNRAGPLLVFGSYSGVVNQAAASVFSISGSTITIKANGLAGTSRYTTIIATPPATWTANTNEVLDLDIEDANGNSSVTIQAGSVSTFEVWKITDATDPDDYDTGTLLDTVGPGKYRFLSADGFKMVIRDQVTNYRVVVEMEKGVYTAELFFGAQVQLAQSATVELLYTLLQTMDVDVDRILANQVVINGGVRKSSLLIPHNTNVTA